VLLTSFGFLKIIRWIRRLLDDAMQPSSLKLGLVSAQLQGSCLLIWHSRQSVTISYNAFRGQSFEDTTAHEIRSSGTSSINQQQELKIEVLRRDMSPWMLAVWCSERDAKRITWRLGLECLKGGTNGNDSNRVLCSSSFVCIVYSVLRHARQSAVRPSEVEIRLKKETNKLECLW